MKTLVRTRRHLTPKFSHVAMRIGPDFKNQTIRENQNVAIFELQKIKRPPQWVTRAISDLFGSMQRCGGFWMRHDDVLADAIRGLFQLAGGR